MQPKRIENCQRLRHSNPTPTAPLLRIFACKDTRFVRFYKANKRKTLLYRGITTTLFRFIFVKDNLLLKEFLGIPRLITLSTRPPVVDIFGYFVKLLLSQAVRRGARRKPTVRGDNRKALM